MAIVGLVLLVDFYFPPQGTLDDVEALLKRHDDFENTLMAQDERLRTFSEMADKLIAAEHYDAKYIHDRRNQVHIVIYHCV